MSDSFDRFHYDRDVDFIKESNKIERIHRDPTNHEIKEFHRFMKLKKITVLQLCKFVSIYQLGAFLRNERGYDVRVGSYSPPRGHPNIELFLKEILKDMDQDTPYKTHLKYESLHPFTDGNGRSGRMLWMWQMKEAPLGFLHTFYYQSLRGR